MFVMLFVNGVAYLIGSQYYIYKLHSRLRGYEQVWQQIEDVADRNEDGTFTIHIQHVEEAHPGEIANTAHVSIADSSGLRLLDLLSNEGDTPPRAA